MNSETKKQDEHVTREVLWAALDSYPGNCELRRLLAEQLDFQTGPPESTTSISHALNWASARQKYPLLRDGRWHWYGPQLGDDRAPSLPWVVFQLLAHAPGEGEGRAFCSYPNQKAAYVALAASLWALRKVLEA